MIDEVILTIIAGKGGEGLVSFRREKYVPKGGPNGGDGGRGGDVVFQATRDLHALRDLNRKKVIQAEDGHTGGADKKKGKAGQCTIVYIPVGSVIYEINSKGAKALRKDFINEGDTWIGATGGRGGWGNWHFATATRQTPRFAQAGQLGLRRVLYIELRLLADVGLVGLPNAGKSTFLARVSNARPKIAHYAFTTLAPNLGVVHHKGVTFVLADIPGLIEGAHQGRGLGDQFLRHISRTKMLVYLIDATAGDIHNQHALLKKELASYDKALLKKPSIRVVNKIDLVQTRSTPGLMMSAATGEGLEDVLDTVITKLSQFD